jgi:type II secretory ATPase GspE/PulE/Tfp pilus assembly ATPase PilB-like protein
MRVLPQEISARIFSRIKDMANMDISERRLPQDGSFSVTYNKRKVDFRVSPPSVNGEKITIRVLIRKRPL